MYLSPSILFVLAMAIVTVTEPELVWKYESESNLYTPPLVADMTSNPGLEIIIGDSEAKKLRCINEGGTQLWEFHGSWSKRLVSTAALSTSCRDGIRRIAIANGDGSLTCVCAETGALLWRQQPVEWGGALWMPGPVDEEQTVVVATEKQGIHAFSETGALLWHLSETQANPPLLIRGPLASGDVDGDGLSELFGASGYGVFRVSGTGELVYMRNTGDDYPGGVALADTDEDGKVEVYAASRYDNFLWRFDAASGEPAWKAPLNAPVDVYSATGLAVGDISGDGRDEIVLGDTAGYVYAFSCTGALLWTFQTHDKVHSAITLGDVTGNGTAEVLAASGDHYLYCLDGQGYPLWRYKTGLRLIAPPTLCDLEGDARTDLLLCGCDRFLRRLATGTRYSRVCMPWPSRRFDERQSGSRLDAKQPKRIQRSVPLTLYGDFEYGKVREGLEQFDPDSPFYEILMSHPRGWRMATAGLDQWGMSAEKARDGSRALFVGGAGTVLSEPIPVEICWRSVSASVYCTETRAHARLQWSGDSCLLREDVFSETDSEGEWKLLTCNDIIPPSGARRLSLALDSEGSPVYWDSAAISVFLEEPARCDVFVNQAGYDLGAPKRFVVQANFQALTADYQVVDSEGTVSEEASLDYAGRIRGHFDNDWGYEYYTGDFSKMENAGTYRIRASLDGTETFSRPFKVAPNQLWTASARAAYRFFYYQRCGMAITGYHGACHLDDARGPDGTPHYPLWGGWHDAGDYNKYHNAPYVYGLACAYGAQREAFDTLGNAPSGFGEFLDEILWGGDHVRRMVMADGSAFGPITSGYGYWGPPELETDNVPGTGDERPGNPISGADPDAHQAALARIAVLLKDTNGSGIEYRKWADTAARSLDYALKTGRRGLWQLSTAVDLYASTGEPQYAGIAAELSGELYPTEGMTDPSAMQVELAQHCDTVLRTRLMESLRPAIMHKAVRMLEDSRNPFGVYTFGPPENPNFFGTPADKGGFHLGTNSHLLDAAGFMALAYRVEPRPEFLVFIYNQFNWVLGMNPYDISLMEGVGSAFLPSYHHRYTYAGIKRGAVPGGIVNGITWRAVRDDRPLLDISGRDIPGYESNEVWLPHNTAFLKALAYLMSARPGEN